MCRSSTEENKNRYESMQKEAKKTVSKAMRDKAEEVLAVFKICPSGIFWLVKGLKIDCKEVEGGICMRGKNGKLYFNEKE